MIPINVITSFFMQRIFLRHIWVRITSEALIFLRIYTQISMFSMKDYNSNIHKSEFYLFFMNQWFFHVFWYLKSFWEDLKRNVILERFWCLLCSFRLQYLWFFFKTNIIRYFPSYILAHFIFQRKTLCPKYFFIIFFYVLFSSEFFIVEIFLSKLFC